MLKHLIEDLKVGVSGDGPSGCVNVEMRLRNMENNFVLFYGMTDVGGIPVCMESIESLYDILMANDHSDKASWDKVYAADLEGYYDDNDPIWELLRYFLYADRDDVEEMKLECIGKYLEDIEIPKLDGDYEVEAESKAENEDIVATGEYEFGNVNVAPRYDEDGYPYDCNGEFDYAEFFGE